MVESLQKEAWLKRVRTLKMFVICLAYLLLQERVTSRKSANAIPVARHV